MVKILADGEIVADDDPRLQSSTTNLNQRRPPNASAFNVSTPPTNSSSSSWSFGLGNPAADGAAGRGGIGAPTNHGAGRAGGGGNEDDAAGGRMESVTIFDLANEKMIEAGFPRLNLGPYSVEPIAVVGTCFALLLFGLPGLLLALGLFLVVKFSRHGVPSLSDMTGGRRVEGEEEGARRRGGGGRDLTSAERPETRRRNPEEEKWGSGQRLGGR